MESEASELSGQKRACDRDGGLDLRQREGGLMRLLALPELHNKHGVRVVVVDSNLVSEAAALPEGFAAPSQMTHQLVALTWGGPKRSHIRKSHGPHSSSPMRHSDDRKA